MSERVQDAPSPPGVLARRRFGQAALSGAASLCMPRVLRAQSSIQPRLELTEFLLQDLQFKLCNWIPPSGDSKGVAGWLDSVGGSLNTLTLIAREEDLDPQVLDIVGKVREVLRLYRGLLHDLEEVDFIDAMSSSSTDGTMAPSFTKFRGGLPYLPDVAKGIWHFRTICSGVVPVAGFAFSGGMAIYSALQSAAAWELAEHRRNISRERKAKLVADAKFGIAREIAELDTVGASLRWRVKNLRVPVFARVHEADFKLDPEQTPFEQVLLAYRLLPRDRIEAARVLAQITERVPSSVKRSRQAGAYVAEYALVAAHMLEQEAQLLNHPQLLLEAVRLFDRAQTLLEPLRGAADSLPYPYQIARGRALIAAGDQNRGLAIAHDIERSAAGDTPVGRAIKSYDLAVLYAQAGLVDRAFAQLEVSYGAQPRRDPQALRDPWLRLAAQTNESRMRGIVDHPLLGTWKSGPYSYVFHPDGTFLQERGDGPIVGRWNVKADTLELTGRRTVPDAFPQLQLFGSEFTLTVAQTRTVFTRVGNGLVDAPTGEVMSRSGRKLTPSGSWAWPDGHDAPSARYTTASSALTKEVTFIYSYHDPAIGRVDETLVQA